MPEVRQSSFALLGDLTKACFQHVKPCIGMSIFYYQCGFLSFFLQCTFYCWLKKNCCSKSRQDVGSPCCFSEGSLNNVD
jgi:hypothetical protein